MRLIFQSGKILLILTLLSNQYSFGQGFTFNCSKDTLVPGCPANLCINLKAIVPDIRSQSTSYSVNPGSFITNCFQVGVLPNDPIGTPASLTIDDRYSNVINLSFPFVFFGTTYNSLIASTNGMISFDISKANLFAHFSIPANLPSASYDRAIIMGPYHDLDPSIGSSPNQRIQYQEFGTAPYRKWVLSFFKVPLFSTSGVCDNLIENTQQIILYESTGIIEVKIFDKQICNSWQGGRAMVGIQDFNRTSSLMAPGRAALDPPWGGINMNETWRFVPNGGPTLFKRVELYDFGGTLVATGTTAPFVNGTLEATFSNICVPAGSQTSYIVKSVYEKIDDPNVEIFGIDTVRINRLNALTASTNIVSANCGVNNGSISVLNINGGTAPYEFSLDGTTWQSTNLFSGLAAGIYTVYIRDFSGTCSANYQVNVGAIGSLSAVTNTTATSCSNVSNGSITVTSSTGTAPFSISLDGGAFVQYTLPHTFTNLSSGAHTVVVRDVNFCVTNSININVAAGPGPNAFGTATSTSCPGVNNGVITVNVSGGTPPFSYQLGANPPQLSNVFNNLAPGLYSITVVDFSGCARNITVSVTAGTSLLASVVSSATSCLTASNGSATITPTNGSGPYNFVLDGGATVSGATSYNFTGLGAGPHTVVITDITTGCLSNVINFTIAAGPLLTTTASKTDVLCNATPTGTITVVQPAAGTAPYEYSLDGTNWQTSPNFTGLAAGVYTVYYKEANGCQNTLSITVDEPTLLAATNAMVPVVCNGQSNGTVTVSASGGVGPYEYSADGGANWQSSNLFNLPAGTYNVITRDFNGCLRPQSVTVTEPAVLTASSLNSNASCNGGNDGTIVVTANGGNSNFAYSIDGTNFQGSNQFNVAPGNYTVTVKDNLGCTTTFPAIIDLSNDLTFTRQVDPTICESKSTQLNFSSNATQYSWAPAIALSSTTVPNPVANPVVSTQYIVTATFGRCSVEDTVMVNVNAAPVPDAGVDGFICYGQTYQLNPSGGVQYKWAPSTYLSNSNISNPISTPAKDVVYTLSVVADANGCASLVTDTMRIDVTPPIKIRTYPFDTVVYEYDTLPILALSSDPDVINWSWSPAFGLDNASINNPIVTSGNLNSSIGTGIFGNETLYTVTGATIAGCKGEGYVKVRIYKGPDLYVPTGFTPNGDGKNDRLVPFPVGIKELRYFRVYNRYGQLVFSTSKLHDGWDGKLLGTDQQTASFVWMAEAVTEANKVITKKGVVTLIR